MRFFNKRTVTAIVISFICMMILPVFVFATGGEEAVVNSYYSTFWALVPPLVAIALA